MSSKKESDTRSNILQASWRLMEQYPGRNISMGDIAKAVGISRQAVYLHFASRTELLIATTHYVDDIKGLNQQLETLQTAKNSIELLEMCITIWGKHIPEIYGVAKSLMMTKATDEAAQAAWDDSMGCLREVCENIIHSLAQEKYLAPEWKQKEAVEFLWTMISIDTWEQLTQECHWSSNQFIKKISYVLKSTLLRK
ncbi:MAG: TetR/AcrR family transcriptional regulator [Gammaproteobacteria bacterium]|nr:TetR/AcrR family transcriptional regulator [Gammaproteobacteria bacterium]MDH5729736.1 TetR/AcrR family transcriptional regulator [Gammaproteobacteria bacterium]